MLRSHSLRAVVVGSALLISVSTRGDEPAAAESEVVPIVLTFPRVDKIVSTAVSPDGRSVYALEYPNSLTVLHREIGSTKLPQGASVGWSKSEEFSHVHVSPDGRYVVMTGRGGTLVLYSREAKVGSVDRLDQVSRKLPPCADWRPGKSCFSPDSTWLLVADAAGAVHSLQIDAGGKLQHRQVLRDAEGRLAGADSIVVHPDGATAFVLCPTANALVVLDRNPADGVLSIRHGFDGKQAALNNLAGGVDLKISADGRFLYVSSGNYRGRFAVSVFQLFSNGKIRLIQELIDVDERMRDVQSGCDLALNLDGSKLFLTAKLHDELLAFDRHLLTGRLTKPRVVYRSTTSQPQWPTGLSISWDGYLFAGQERGNNLLIFRLPGAEIAKEPPPPPPRTIRTEPKKVDPKDYPKILAPKPTEPKPTATKPTATKPEDKKPAATKPPESKPAEPKPAATKPAATKPDDKKPVEAKPMPTADGAETARITGHRYEATDVAFSPDGRRLVSGGADSTIRIWDAATATGIREISTTASLDVAWSPNGKLVASCGRDGEVVLWDSDTGEPRQNFRIKAPLGHGLAFSPDGKQLATTSRGAVTVWNIADNREVRTYKQEMEIINSVAFSPDGKLAACCGGYFNNSDTPLGPILRVWRLDDGEVLFSRRTNIRSAIRAVAFSPDGRLVAAADLDDRGIGVWDWEKRERVKLFDNQSGTPNELRFMKSGNFLVAAQAGGVVIYDMATSKKAFSFGGNAGSASSVDISPDGSFAVSANSDKTIRLWRVPEPIRATVPPRKP